MCLFSLMLIRERMVAAESHQDDGKVSQLWSKLGENNIIMVMMEQGINFLDFALLQPSPSYMIRNGVLVRSDVIMCTPERSCFMTEAVVV